MTTKMIDYLTVRMLGGANCGEIWEVPATNIENYKRYRNWCIGAFYKMTPDHFNGCGCELLAVNDHENYINNH